MTPLEKHELNIIKKTFDEHKIPNKVFDKLIEYNNVWNIFFENICHYVENKYDIHQGLNDRWILHSVKLIDTEHYPIAASKQKIKEFIRHHLLSKKIYFNIYVRNKDAKTIKIIKTDLKDKIGANCKYIKSLQCITGSLNREDLDKICALSCFL